MSCDATAFSTVFAVMAHSDDSLAHTCVGKVCETLDTVFRELCTFMCLLCACALELHDSTLVLCVWSVQL